MICHLYTFNSKEANLALEFGTFVIFVLKLLEESLFDLPQWIVSVGLYDAFRFSCSIGDEFYVPYFIFSFVIFLHIFEKFIHLQTISLNLYIKLKILL